MHTTEFIPGVENPGQDVVESLLPQLLNSTSKGIAPKVAELRHQRISGAHCKKNRQSTLSIGQGVIASSSSDCLSMAEAVGGNAIAAASGNGVVATSNGYTSASVTTGDNSYAGSLGDGSAAMSLGTRSVAAAEGDHAIAVTSGYGASSQVSGQGSVAVASSDVSRAKAGPYGCIVLGYWNEAAQRKEIRCGEVGCGDGSDGKLKADTWYTCGPSGEIVEFESDLVAVSQ